MPGSSKRSPSLRSPHQNPWYTSTPPHMGIKKYLLNACPKFGSGQMSKKHYNQRQTYHLFTTLHSILSIICTVTYMKLKHHDESPTLGWFISGTS
jgi:hypothetical protein